MVTLNPRGTINNTPPPSPKPQKCTGLNVKCSPFYCDWGPAFGSLVSPESQGVFPCRNELLPLLLPGRATPCHRPPPWWKAHPCPRLCRALPKHPTSRHTSHEASLCQGNPTLEPHLAVARASWSLCAHEKSWAKKHPTLNACA